MEIRTPSESTTMSETNLTRCFRHIPRKKKKTRVYTAATPAVAGRRVATRQTNTKQVHDVRNQRHTAVFPPHALQPPPQPERTRPRGCNTRSRRRVALTGAAPQKNTKQAHDDKRNRAHTAVFPLHAVAPRPEQKHTRPRGSSNPRSRSRRVTLTGGSRKTNTKQVHRKRNQPHTAFPLPAVAPRSEP